MSAAYPQLRVVLSSRSVTGVDPSAMCARGYRVLQVKPLMLPQVYVRVARCVLLART